MIYEITVICILIDLGNGKNIKFYNNNNNPDIYIDGDIKLNLEITTNLNKKKENQLKKFISIYQNDDFILISSKTNNKQNLSIYGKEVNILKISDFNIFEKILNNCYFVNFILINNPYIFSHLYFQPALKNFLNNFYLKETKKINEFMEKINELDLFLSKSNYNIKENLNILKSKYN